MYQYRPLSCLIRCQRPEQFLDLTATTGERRAGRGQPGKRRGHRRRQLNSDVPALNHCMEEHPATDLVGHTPDAIRLFAGHIVTPLRQSRSTQHSPLKGSGCLRGQRN